MEKRGLRLPDEDWDPHHKIVSKKVLRTIFGMYDEKGCKTPLFLKSSCAVSYFEELPDFNAHWTKPEKNCSPFCPQSQRELCAAQSRKSIPAEISRIAQTLTREEKTFYRQKHRLQVG